MRLSFIKLSNLFMRGVSLGAKFVFALYISKFLEVDDYGEYNLIVTSITFLMFVIGVDFYSYSAREILAVSGKKRFLFIKHQFLFHLVIYILFAPIAYLICAKFLRVDIFSLFYCLLIAEHFSQELYRIFIFHDKQLVANGLLFLRTFFWISLISIYILVLGNDIFSIDLILKFWIIGSVLSCISGLVLLFLEYPLPFRELIGFHDFDIKIIKKGLVICLPIFIGTISYKLIEYSDRFIIDAVLDKTQVGVYSLYSNFSNITNIIVNTIVTLMIFPKMVAAAKKEDFISFNGYRRKFKKELLWVTLGTSLFLILAVFPILDWIDKTIYFEYLASFFILVIANIFLNMSFLSHYMLYAFNQDKKNIMPTIIAMIINVLLNFILLSVFQNIIGAAIATMISFLLIYFMKTRSWVNFKKGKLFLNEEK